jgi:hypothetical protein
VRFASVYKNFEKADDFQKFIKQIVKSWKFINSKLRTGGAQHDIEIIQICPTSRLK